MDSGASLALEHSLNGDQAAVTEFLNMQQRPRAPLPGDEEEDDEDDEDAFREYTELLNDMAPSFYSDSAAREEEEQAAHYERRTQELMRETQNQLLELMSAAMRATSYKDSAAPINPAVFQRAVTVQPTATPDMMTHIEQLRTWDQDISSLKHDKSHLAKK